MDHLDPPPLTRRRARVRVPASTSNLGPGFDQLGLALGLFLEVEARVEPGRSGPPRYEAPAGWPSPERDLVLRALVARAPELAEVGLELRIASEIPIARGLGSSGAAVAAGLLLGELLTDRHGTDAERIGLGIALEGHPDNVTASLLGGLTLCVPGREGPIWIQPPVHESLGFAAAWPAQPFPTAEARGALPSSVPLADAVENARRLPLLLEGLRTGDGHCIAAGAQDRLHEPYRLPLLPGSKEALAAARGAGAYAAVLSGSGSALIAIGPRRLAAAMAAALAAPLRATRGWSEGRALDVIRGRPRIEMEVD